MRVGPSWATLAADEALGLRFVQLPLASRVALAVALAALWLFGRRYAGLTHDAALYAALGLHSLDPAAFAGDPALASGGQGDYTLFPRLYALLIQSMGLGAAAMATMMAGQASFFLAAAALAWRLAQGPARWWSLALLASASGYYGGAGIFRFAESFATARSLAEPLVVAAFAFALGSRLRSAWFAIAAAALLHPLVALPGAAVLLLWQALRMNESRWLAPAFAAAIVAAAVVAALWGGRFDAPWREAVAERSPQVFLALWEAPDWARIVWGLCVLRLAGRFAARDVRRLAIAVGACAVAGIVATGIAVDVLGSATIAALQPWRAHWLMHLIAILLLPAAVAGLWRRGQAGGVAAACLAASACFGRAELAAAAALAVLALGFDAIDRRRPGRIGARGAYVLVVLAACAASAGLLFEIQSRLPLSYAAPSDVAWTDYVHAAGSVGGLLPLALLLWLAASSRYRAVGVGLAAAALAVAVLAWDARAPWPRFIEDAAARPDSLRDKIPPGASVFWPMPHSPVWIVLRRPAWFSVDQGAGIVFNRAAALVYAERKVAAQPLADADVECRASSPDGCRSLADAARALCARPKGPDYLVFGARPRLYDCAAPVPIEKGRR